MSEDATAKEALRLAKRLKPLLKGHPPQVQSAALAELLSIWVSGHHAATLDETLSLRAELLNNHLALVMSLLVVETAKQRSDGDWSTKH